MYMHHNEKDYERVEKKLLHHIGKGINTFNLIEPGDRLGSVAKIKIT